MCHWNNKKIRINEKYETNITKSNKWDEIINEIQNNTKQWNHDLNHLQNQTLTETIE
jgi:predicted flavoprotein YhiN